MVDHELQFYLNYGHIHFQNLMKYLVSDYHIYK
ncbi:hypothetical protein T09_15198 [Trichinella sp. T9]|nr:hypothetical protein T09_15198 [Trichinella sp. T9]